MAFDVPSIPNSSAFPSSVVDASTINGRVPTKALDQDFLKLLVAQITTQDPLNPKSDIEMIPQMVSFSTLAQSQSMQSDIALLRTEQATLRASTLFRLTVQLQADGQTQVVGTVSAVQMVEGTPKLVVNGQAYGLEQVISVMPPLPAVVTPEPPSPPQTPRPIGQPQLPSQLHHLMLRSLYSAISGLQNFQERLDVIGNNVANVNTTGFKSARVDLADSFSQTLRASSASTGGSAGSSAIQVGTGVVTTAIKNIYTQGALARTGFGTDLAIAGNGFFVVRDTVSDVEYATRAGDFRVDDTGFLVTNTGQRVQGWSDATLTVYGDIQIDTVGMPATSDPAATMTSFAIDDQGRLNVNLSDGSQFVRGQLLLQNFGDPQALMKEGNNLYSGLGSAGALAAPSVAGTNGLGKIYSGALKTSNVNLANEFTNLITTQRAYQANARIITTSDEMLQELVNLKR